jgi:hypothetical protein
MDPLQCPDVAGNAVVRSQYEALRAGAADPTQEVGRPRRDHRSAEAKLLGLRDQRDLARAGLTLSPTGVREVLKAKGFAALPRRLDDDSGRACAAR